MASLQTYIRTQIKSCWEIPNALFNEEKIYIIIQIRLNENGEVVNSKIINKDQYYHNEYFEKLKNSALSAIDRCSPILGLNKKDYSKWKEIELIFDPGKLYN